MGSGMPIDYRVFLIIAPFTGASVLALSLLLLSKRDRPGGRFLIGFSLAAFAFLLSDTFGLLSTSLFWTLFWAKLEHVWVELMPIMWILFVFSLTRLKRWTRIRIFWPLTVIPLAEVLASAAYPYDHLTWQHVRYIHVGNMISMAPGHGPLFFGALAYAYLLLLGGLVLIVREYFVGHSIYRRQMLWITGGIVVPIAFNATYVFHLIPGLVKDFTSLGFAIGALFFLAAIYESKFLVLSPLSRTRIFDVIADGIVVLDDALHIADLNEAAMRFLELDEGCLGGPMPAESQVTQIVEHLEPELDRARMDLHVGGTGNRQDFEVTVRRLTAKHDGRNGALLVLRDVTERSRLTEEIRTLRGILPICANCKKIRDDDGFWKNVEAYIAEHSQAEFSHGLCPDCREKLYPKI